MYFQGLYSVWTTESMPWMNKCLALELPPAFSASKHSITNTPMNPYPYPPCLPLREAAQMWSTFWDVISAGKGQVVGAGTHDAEVVESITDENWEGLSNYFNATPGWLIQLVSQGHTWWQGVIILGRNSHLLNLSIRVGEELSCSSHLPYRFEGRCMERSYG